MDSGLFFYHEGRKAKSKSSKELLEKNGSGLSKEGRFGPFFLGLGFFCYEGR